MCKVQPGHLHANSDIHVHVGAEAVSGTGYDVTTELVPLRIDCFGNETQFSECHNYGLVDEVCSHFAAVRCQCKTRSTFTNQ